MRLRKHRGPEIVRQRVGRQYVDWQAQQLAQLHAERTEVEERGVRRRIDQDVQVALLGAGTAKDGSEHLGIAASVRFDDAQDGVAVDQKSFRRFHARGF